MIEAFKFFCSVWFLYNIGMVLYRRKEYDRLFLENTLTDEEIKNKIQKKVSYWPYFFILEHFPKKCAREDNIKE